MKKKKYTAPAAKISAVVTEKGIAQATSLFSGAVAANQAEWDSSVTDIGDDLDGSENGGLYAWW
jgi:hypothetical protein